MAKKKHTPTYDSDDDVEAYIQNQAGNSGSESEEYEEMDFSKLKKANQQLEQMELEEQKEKNKHKKGMKVDKAAVQRAKDALKEQMKAIKKHEQSKYQSESEDNDSMFESDDSDSGPEEVSHKHKKRTDGKGKHAPTEQSSKKKAPKVRQIPGLESSKTSSLYKDIRFDTAFGKADLARIRKDYKFLDDYRQQEVNEINKMLKDPKMTSKLSYKEVQDLEYQAKSLKSRLDTLKNRDLQQDVLKKYKEEHNIKGKFFLKKSDERKIVQKHKFESMKASQREKVVERKRKRKLGKEFKQLEFNSRS